MTLAFVLINTELGEGSAVENLLREIDEVKESWPVYGVYDIIVKLETIDMATLKDVISYKIRRIENVRSTLTLIAME
jgi:DNA-binding Lrp family transcriptional regulator